MPRAGNPKGGDFGMSVWIALVAIRSVRQVSSGLAYLFQCVFLKRCQALSTRPL